METASNRLQIFFVLENQAQKKVQNFMFSFDISFSLSKGDGINRRLFVCFTMLLLYLFL